MSGQVEKESGFGTIKGVYIPSLLTIFGVVMFLRMGWVVGHVGLTSSFLIISISSLITFLTGLSIASTATNMRIEGGGAYFMISRSFGIEAGAAVGIPLWLAQSLGISFYITGFSESVYHIFPVIDPLIISISSLLILSIITFISANLALKAQGLIFVIISAALASFFLGDNALKVSEVAMPETTLGFWAVFAVFFPAVTGIEAGLSMSGELKNPSKSLPWGTLCAIVTGWIMYLVMAYVLSLRADQYTLLMDNMLVVSTAKYSMIVLAGIWGATLSSALGALLGAPRTLQAISRDRIIPKIFSKGSGAKGEPRIATVTSFFVALAGILLGDLEAIGTLLTMFFLTSYGMLNAATTMESFINNPSWRPAFQSRWWASACGALGCLFAMVMISPGATLIATFLCICVYIYTAKRRLASNWVDMRRALLLQSIRWCMYKLKTIPPNSRTWRPNALVICKKISPSSNLISLANALTNNKGFLSITVVKNAKVDPEQGIQKLEMTYTELLNKKGFSAMIEVEEAPSFLEGVGDIITYSGFGPLIPNTFFFSLNEDEEISGSIAQIMTVIEEKNKNVILLRENESWNPWRPSDSRANIHIWLDDHKENNAFILSLSQLLQNSIEWRNANLTIYYLVEREEQCQPMKDYMDTFLKESRLDAVMGDIVVETTHKLDLIKKFSSSSQLILTGGREFSVREDEDSPISIAKILDESKDLPPLAFCVPHQDIEFSSILN